MGLSTHLKRHGVGSSMCLMCLDLRSDVPCCTSTYKREENIERGEENLNYGLLRLEERDQRRGEE